MPRVPINMGIISRSIPPACTGATVGRGSAPRRGRARTAHGNQRRRSGSARRHVFDLRKRLRDLRAAAFHFPRGELGCRSRAGQRHRVQRLRCVGLAGGAQKRYDGVDYTPPTALVVGAEGKGLRRLVRERCDWVVSIPMNGHVQSLNVSVALGIVLFEAVRQRQKGTERVGRVGS